MWRASPYDPASRRACRTRRRSRSRAVREPGAAEDSPSPMLPPRGEWGCCPAPSRRFLPTRRRSKPAAREAFAMPMSALWYSVRFLYDVVLADRADYCSPSLRSCPETMRSWFGRDATASHSASCTSTLPSQCSVAHSQRNGTGVESLTWFSTRSCRRSFPVRRASGSPHGEVSGRQSASPAPR